MNVKSLFLVFAFQTAVLFESYFIQSIWKTDTDSDGMSDYFESIIYHTDISSGKHGFSIIFDGSIKYPEINILSAYSNVPCQKIIVKIGHDYDPNYITETYTSSSGQYQSISNQFFTVHRVDISFVTLTIYFYEYQITDNYDFEISIFSFTKTYIIYNDPHPLE